MPVSVRKLDDRRILVPEVPIFVSEIRDFMPTSLLALEPSRGSVRGIKLSRQLMEYSSGTQRLLMALNVAFALALLTLWGPPTARAYSQSVSLTNSAGCTASDGATGDSYSWTDAVSGVNTYVIGNPSGCEIRKIDSYSYKYGSNWVYQGSSGYVTYNLYFSDDSGAAVGARATHRICGVGPVCGTQKFTEALAS